jgi:hypothetical protein
MESKLFQFAVIWNPTEDQADNGEKSKLVVPITTELATSKEAISMRAVRAIPSKYDDQLDQLSVVVRPF